MAVVYPVDREALLGALQAAARSGSVEPRPPGKVNPKLRSSLEAAALAKMALRGQITGGVVDGPLSSPTSRAAAC